MARILDFFLNRSTNTACNRFPDSEALFEALVREDSSAIQCLYARTAGSIYNIGKGKGLTTEDIEELICDCITIFIQKTRQGEYVFSGYHPASYVLEIARFKAMNFRRSQFRRQTQSLETASEQQDGTLSNQFESAEWVAIALENLDENCRKLIRLKYLDGYRDKELIDKQMTQYTTVDALKNHRSKCLKKLAALADRFEFDHE